MDLDVQRLAETLAGYLALLYTTAAAQVHPLVFRMEGLTKNNLLAAPRNPMASMRVHLPDKVQNFLDAYADEIETSSPRFTSRPDRKLSTGLSRGRKRTRWESSP